MQPEAYGRGVRRPDGTPREGGFRNVMYHGQGVCTDVSGKRHEGDWREGTFHGGVRTSPNPNGRRVT